MREIDVKVIADTVAELSKEANFFLGDDVTAAFQKGMENETSKVGKEVFRQLLENARIAREEQVPMCQDTGYPVVFIELGQEIALVGGYFNEAVNEGIRRGYKEGYLRNSIVNDPLERKNTGDNTPAVVHVELVPGDKIGITVMPKGGGSENTGQIKMLTPSQGMQGLIDFVVDTVKKSGPNPCPPIIVGVGFGATFEKVAFLAKKALLRPVGQFHHNPFYADLEQDLLRRINNTGIGPMGFGGRITALDVNIETSPCHIGTMPAAVNINCHASRHARRVI